MLYSMTTTKADRFARNIQAGEDRESARQTLRDLFPKGSTVHTVVRHVSQSGMERAISVLAYMGKGPEDNGTEGEIVDVSYLVARAGLYPQHPRQPGLKVRGCGMDMAWNVSYVLGRVLRDDGYALRHRHV